MGSMRSFLRLRSRCYFKNCVGVIKTTVAFFGFLVFSMVVKPESGVSPNSRGPDDIKIC